MFRTYTNLPGEAASERQVVNEAADGDNNDEDYGDEDPTAPPDYVIGSSPSGAPLKIVQGPGAAPSNILGRGPTGFGRDPDLQAVLPPEVLEEIKHDMDQMSINGFLAQDEGLSLLRFPYKEGMHRASEYNNLLILALVLFSTISLPAFITPPQFLLDKMDAGWRTAIFTHFLLGIISLLTLFTATCSILVSNVLITYPAHRQVPCVS